MYATSLLTYSCTFIYVHTPTYAYARTYTTCMQASFWKYLSQPASEKFFHEIHSHFQEAQAELKKQAEGLKKLDESTTLVSSILRRRAGAKKN